VSDCLLLCTLEILLFTHSLTYLRQSEHGSSNYRNSFSTCKNIGQWRHCKVIVFMHMVSNHNNTYTWAVSNMTKHLARGWGAVCNLLSSFLVHWYIIGIIFTKIKSVVFIPKFANRQTDAGQNITSLAEVILPCNCITRERWHGPVKATEAYSCAMGMA